MVKNTKNLLRMSKNEAKNEVAEAINAILDCVQMRLTDNPDAARQMYELILGDLKNSNERLWFDTSLRLGQSYLTAKNYEVLNDLVHELKKACKKPDARSDDLLDVDNYD